MQADNLAKTHAMLANLVASARTQPPPCSAPIPPGLPAMMQTRGQTGTATAPAEKPTPIARHIISPKALGAQGSVYVKNPAVDPTVLAKLQKGDYVAIDEAGRIIYAEHDEGASSNRLTISQVLHIMAMRNIWYTQHYNGPEREEFAAGMQIYLMRVVKNIERHSLDTVCSIDRELLQHALLPFSQGDTTSIELLHMHYRTYEDEAYDLQKDRQHTGVMYMITAIKQQQQGR